MLNLSLQAAKAKREIAYFSHLPKVVYSVEDRNFYLALNYNEN